MKAFPDPNNTQSHGMDLRDWFAGLAMQAILSRPDESFQTNLNYVGTKSYQYADMMMQERKEKNDA